MMLNRCKLLFSKLLFSKKDPNSGYQLPEEDGSAGNLYNLCRTERQCDLDHETNQWIGHLYN